MRVPSRSLVEVYHHAEFAAASYGGLQTCGSVHVCPVCSSKIAERRKIEVTAGLTTWADRGGGFVLATFTLRHELGDSLTRVAAALNGAYREIKRSKAWASFERRYGVIGSIAAREYTHGRHGWHPHLHVVFFTRGGLTAREIRQLESWLAQRWASAVGRLGGFASLDHAVTCRRGARNDADYVTKAGRSWSLGDELVKSNSKGGRRGSRSVPQLLGAAGRGDELAGRLFQEYAHWTYRTNALVWSRGLRAALGLVVEEKTDEEIAGELLEGARLLVVLEREQWRVILAHDARAEVLLVASAGDVGRVAGFLAQFGIDLAGWQLAGQAVGNLSESFESETGATS